VVDLKSGAFDVTKDLANVSATADIVQSEVTILRARSY
jgi:hypothetical protein